MIQFLVGAILSYMVSYVLGFDDGYAKGRKDQRWDDHEEKKEKAVMQSEKQTWTWTACLKQRLP